jgi:catechol 2,3-dioxygenase-like lactoylglutathione lyase family enzyme
MEMKLSSGVLRRRDLLGVVCALAVPGPAQAAAPLFEVAALDHINIRASNPTRSAHFYQSLFGGELTWIESIPPNPTSPAAESWYLMLGRHFLSISPAFPNLQLGPGLDHICPALRGYQAVAATSMLKERGIETLSGGGLWIRDPDGMLYQLRDDRSGGPARPPAQTKLKAGDPPAPVTAPFTPVGIDQLALRVADLNKAAAFYDSVFGNAAPSGPAQSRSYRFGDCTLRLTARQPALSSGTGSMERMVIAIENFSTGRARRALQDRGISLQGDSNAVRFADPDGIPVQLVSAGAPR